MNAIIVLFITGILALFLGLFEKRKAILPVSVLGVSGALGLVIYGLNGGFEAFNDQFKHMLEFDGFALKFSVIVLFTTILLLVFAHYSFRRLRLTLGDNIGLMLFSLCGALCLFSYTNLVMLFLGIEILSIPLYVLAGSRRDDLRGNEAAIKYFLQGAFATGILLFGIALIYGSTASFDIYVIAGALDTLPALTPMVKIGIVLVMAGMGFKIAATPFHFWSPDVYQGSPSLVTAFMATVVKTASFVAFFKLFSIAFAPAAEAWIPILSIIAALSMTLANFVAIFQDNFKRMMAYSSISHTGYMLLAVLAFASTSAISGLWVYAFSYSIATVLAFGIFILVSDDKAEKEVFEAFNGLGEKQPLLAGVMALSMLSLAGIPPLAGFFGKYMLFSAAFEQYTWLVIIAILNSAISIYYYFKVIIAMFFKENETNLQVERPLGFTVVLGLGALILVAFMFFPNYFM